ncbi:DNA mismatch repair protein MutS [Prevotella rectalis]|uniref:DNA mismatch repair protein MutS n=1 Tax=Prevotella rectalis TaxID=2219999 RepID=UPI0010318443|nr:DNA mismatch repair protein MutS [Prevotella brunnea]
MEGKVKPLVEQEKAVRRDSESLSDKKTAKKSEVFYSSVAYLQAGEDIKDISAMHKRGHLNKLLTTVASYDHGEAINLNSTFKSPLQNKGDELLRENKNYAVVYNSVVGGTYEVFRKVQAQEVKMNIERYGLSENSTNDVKQLYKANESRTQKQSDSSSLSPIMKRYTSMKEQHPDALLLFRVGDSFKSYNEDAVKASKHLGIELSSQQDGTKQVEFPKHELDTYLPMLIKAKERVAIVDQVENILHKQETQSKRQEEDVKLDNHRNPQKSSETIGATSDQQQKFIDDIKAAMGTTRMVVLPDFGTQKGVVAGTGEDKGISLSRVYAWNDNISFAGSVPGDDAQKRRYYHPENIRPEFYDYLVSEVKKAVAPQLITENGQKVTSANLYESPKQEGKYFFYARLDGVGLHPKAVKPQDVEAFMKQELSVKDMFEKYYPTKIAKQLDKEDFDSLKLSDGNELTKFRVYKQRNEEKSHFGEYLLYAEMGNKRFHATPLSHDQLDAYFDKTQSKGQIAEKVIGEQLHLKSAYEKYKLPDNIPIQEVRVRKVPDGNWLISASLGNKGQTPEHKVSSNDLYSLFKSKTATREQLAAKYLTEDIKELSRSKPLERSHGLKR